MARTHFVVVSNVGKRGLSAQSNFNDSNTNGSFAMANSNSFLSPYEDLSIAKENKYVGKCSYFIMKLYVMCY